jgi:capsular exopolysaccharide synthesis family protein
MNDHDQLPSLPPVRRDIAAPVEPHYGGWSAATIEMAPPGAPGEPVHYPQILWKGKFWILALMLVGAAGGFAWVVFQAPVYSATTLIEVVGINESFLGMNQLDPQAGAGNYSATASNIQTQTRILTSGALRQRVAERVGVEMTPISATPAGIFSKLRNRLGILEQEPVELMRTAIKGASKSTRAKGVGASRLLEVSCESISPEVAANFANTLATEYVSQNAQARSTAGLRTTQWMEGQLEETKNRVEQAEARLLEFIRKSGNTFVLDQTTLEDSKLRQLQTELSSSQADRITKESRWDLAKSSPVDSLPEILDDGRMRDLKNRITELRRERAQLTTTLTPEHYKVQRIDAQIREIEQTLQGEKANLVKRIQNEYESALRREKLLYQAYRSQSGMLANQVGKASDYTMFKREAELARQVYNNLLQQLNQANVIVALPTSNLRVIEPAAPAIEPVRPVPERDIPVATFLGGLLGAGILILRDRRRQKNAAQSFASPGHSSALLRVPELGVIPSFEEAGASRWQKVRSKAPKFLPFATNGAANGTSQREMATWRQKPSMLAESFRYTITSLFGGKGMAAKAVLVVTSPGPREGKTTLASNLAIATVETGRRVLLVDADLRLPRLHEIFGVDLSPGVKEVLSSDMPVDEIDLEEAIRETEVPGLSILPAGETGDSAAAVSLLFSTRLAALIGRLRDAYDVVIIDTAPSLYFPDARLLGRLSDGVILVVRAGVTNRDSAMTAAQRFQNDHVPVLGTILNDWDASEGGPGGYYHYGSYYQRGKGGKS